MLLEYMKLDPLFPEGRRTTCMTFAMTYAFSENYILVPVSHDEVVHRQALHDQ